MISYKSSKCRLADVKHSIANPIVVPPLLVVLSESIERFCELLISRAMYARSSILKCRR